MRVWAAGEMTKEWSRLPRAPDGSPSRRGFTEDTAEGQQPLAGEPQVPLMVTSSPSAGRGQGHTVALYPRKAVPRDKCPRHRL